MCLSIWTSCALLWIQKRTFEFSFWKTAVWSSLSVARYSHGQSDPAVICSSEHEKFTFLCLFVCFYRRSFAPSPPDVSTWLLLSHWWPHANCKKWQHILQVSGQLHPCLSYDFLFAWHWTCRLWSGLQQHVLWWLITSVSEESASSIICLEDGDSMFLWNISKQLWKYMVP